MIPEKKIATRESYGQALLELGRLHENVVVLDADLAESTKTAVFRKEFPHRHIDCGIAEANMMASTGFALSLLIGFYILLLLQCLHLALSVKVFCSAFSPISLLFQSTLCVKISLI